MPNAVLRALVPTMLATLLAMLAACVPAGTGGDAPTPAPAAEISVTSLPPASEVVAAPAAAGEGAVGQTPEAPTPADAPAEGAAEVSAEAAPPSPPPPSPQALACQRRGGAYRAIRPGGPRTCLMQTGEGTKRCTRQTDCKGQCLARSGTCSPITPLFGCNEILQADGRRATLCIE